MDRRTKRYGEVFFYHGEAPIKMFQVIAACTQPHLLASTLALHLSPCSLRLRNPCFNHCLLAASCKLRWSWHLSQRRCRPKAKPLPPLGRHRKKMVAWRRRTPRRWQTAACKFPISPQSRPHTPIAAQAEATTQAVFRSHRRPCAHSCRICSGIHGLSPRIRGSPPTGTS